MTPQTRICDTPNPKLPVFVYGTLCIPEVRATLLRVEVRAEPAHLDDAEVRRVRGHTYPTVVLGRSGRVDGLLLWDLEAEHRRILREFEPPVYDLVGVTVHSEEASVACVVFVHQNAGSLTEETWAPATFDGGERERFLAEVERASEILWNGEAFQLDGGI